MATFLYKLGRFAFRRRHAVTLLWIALLALAGVGAASAPGGHLRLLLHARHGGPARLRPAGGALPGGSADGATARVVFQAPDGGKMTDPAGKAAVEQAVDELRTGSDQVAAVTDPYTAKAVSQDGSTAYIHVSYKVSGMELTDETKDALTEAGEGPRRRYTVEIGGDALQAAPETGTGRSSASSSPGSSSSSPSAPSSPPDCR